MNTNPIAFLHGLKGSPQGTKSVFLKKHFPDCVIPELPEDLHLRMEIIQEMIKTPTWIIGSSLGGLSAVMFAMEYPHLVKGMVLIAPAVGFYDESICSVKDLSRIKTTYIPERINCSVLAGKYDDVIPLEAIQQLLERSPDKSLIELLVLDDDHSLNQSLETLLVKINRLMHLV